MKTRSRIAAFAAALFTTVLAPAAIAQAAPPANDNFVNAQALTVGATVNGTTTDATYELDEPGYPSATAWYKLAAPSAGWVSFQVCPDGGGIVNVNGYTGTALANLVDNDQYDSSAYCDEPVRVQVTGAATAYLQVDSASAFTVTATFQAAPANDAFASPATLTGASSSVAFDNTAATVEPGEVADSYYDGHSLWYSWTAPATGVLYLSACAPRPDTGYVETVVTLYTGSALGSLTAVDSDYSGCSSPMDGGSIENVSVTGGVTYRIKLASYYGDERYGAGTLRLGFYSDVPNQTVATAIDLGADLAVETTGNNIFADNAAEPGEPAINGAMRTKSVWYKWTAPVSGDYRLDQCQETVYSADLVIGAFSSSGPSNPAASELSALTPVAGTGDDDCTSLGNYNRAGWITIAATAGTTYWIAVANYTSGDYAGGPFSLRIGLASRTASTAPKISGSPFVGSELTASDGTWTAATPLSITHQWMRCDVAGDNCAAIGGATASALTLTEDDFDHTIRDEVTATNAFGATTLQTVQTALIDHDSDADGVGDDGDNCPSHDNEAPKTNGCPITPITVIAGPSIAGTPLVGSALTLSLGAAQNANSIDNSTSPATPSFEWQSCSAPESGCASRGSASLSYAPDASDGGRFIRASVTWSNGDSTKVLAASTATAVPPVTQADGLTIPGQKKLGTFKGAVKTRGKYVNKKFKLSCAAGGAACVVKVAVTAKVRKKTVKLGTFKFTIPAGSSRPLQARLSRTGLKIVKKQKKLKAQLSITGGSGKVSMKEFTITK